MKLFLYEFITGGGLLDQAAPPSGSLLAEGRAMLSALAKDMTQIHGIDIMVTQDVRIYVDLPPQCRVRRVSDPAEEQDALVSLAGESDATIVIAPEFDGVLLERSESVLAAGGTLLSCPPDTVRIASDKQRTAELLAAAGVPTPVGCVTESAQQISCDVSFPAVMKPNDGAGSQGVRKVLSRDELPLESGKWRWRLERYCPGQAVSCAVLCGPSHQLPLPACEQRVADDGTFAYLGGSVPLDRELDRRARALAERAVAALPGPLGYVGVDMILGAAADGSDDVVIEINPRLTTSYIGLRQLAKTNLAAAMLDVVGGKPPEISWRDGCVEFLADGTIVRSDVVTV